MQDRNHALLILLLVYYGPRNHCIITIVDTEVYLNDLFTGGEEEGTLA